MKRLLALLLCLMMCVSLIPAAAAEDIEIVEIEPAEVEVPVDPPDGDTVDVIDLEEDPVDPVVRPGTDEPMDVITYGGCGDNVYWQLEEYGDYYWLTIYGYGAMDDYSDSSETPWYPYRDYIQVVYICEGVTHVGEYAFYDFESLTDATIAGDVGKYAFYNCVNLSSVSFIGNDVTILDWCAFRNCTSLQYIALPDTLLIIDYAAFWGSGLVSVTIPDSVTTIGLWSFYGCTDLKYLTFGNGLTEIPNCSFEYCSSLSYIIVPESISIVGHDAFAYCTALEYVWLNGVTEVWSDVFKDCTSLIRIEFSPYLEYIGERTLSGCSALESIVFQGNAPSFGENCMEGVYGNVYFPADNETWYNADLSNCGYVVFHPLYRANITVQPCSITAPIGATARFIVEAEGSELSYTWYQYVPEEDYWTPCAYDSVMDVTVSEETDGKQYFCVVYNELGEAWSDTVTLTALTMPFIYSQPQSVTIGEGKTATFSVEALNAESYQWQYRKSSSGSWSNSTAASAKTSTFSVTAESYRNGYQYRCKVTNAFGTTYSQAATLTVISKPVITTQPKSVSTALGKTVKFTVAATDAESYQWQYRKSSSGTWSNSTAAGAKTSTFSVTAESYRNGYQYRCKVSNAGGYVYSSAATLSIVEKPVITLQPQSTAICAGQSVEFRVAATDAASYQWYYRTSSSNSWAKCSADSAKTATLSYTGVSVGHNGYQYRCKVSNAAGYTYTNAATLTVTLAPVITTQPQDLTISAGEDATFTVKASGALSYQWQWRKDSSDSWKNCSVSTATSETLVYTNLSAEKSGRQYRCRVANDKAYTYSDIVTLTVTGNAKPTITSQPSSINASPDTTVKFKVVASGATSYQWYYRTSSSGSWAKSTLTGATTATLSVKATTTRSGYQYRCKVSNANGYVYSSAATLTVTNGAKPTITTQPTSVAASVDATAKFTVKASGATEYQWYYRTSSSGSWAKTSLSGNTTATLSVKALTTRNGYQYRCKVSNDNGYVYSNAATLTVLPASTVTYRALLIGQTYAGNIDGVGVLHCDNDVQLLKSTFSTVQGAKGGNITVTTRTNASYSGIQSAISTAFAGADDDDVSIFYYSGHGVADSTGSAAGAIVTLEADGSVDLVYLSELAGWLKNVPGKVVVMLDSCGSGAAVYQNGQLVSFNADTDAFNAAVIDAFAAADEVLIDNTGEFRESKFYVLTASAHLEYSWENSTYGCFTYYFATGIGSGKPADANGNGTITLSEIYNYVYPLVAGITHYDEYGNPCYQHVQVYPANSSYALFK